MPPAHFLTGVRTEYSTVSLTVPALDERVIRAFFRSLRGGLPVDGEDACSPAGIAAGVNWPFDAVTETGCSSCAEQAVSTNATASATPSHRACRYRTFTVLESSSRGRQATGNGLQHKCGFAV